MSDPTNFRTERIEKLLHELRYEVERGMMEGDLKDETIYFRFYVPISRSIPDGVVMCEFHTRPIPSCRDGPKAPTAQTEAGEVGSAPLNRMRMPAMARFTAGYLERVGRDWQDAYAKVNGRKAPPIAWESGWFRIKYDGYQPRYRRAQLERMTRTLRDRIDDARP